MTVKDFSKAALESQKSFQPPWKINTLQMPDGTLIRYGIYAKNPEKIKKFVVYLNGHSEYIERYDYLPQDLALPEDWAFLTWDHRSQGLSSGSPRLHFDDYHKPAQDAQFLLKTLVGDKPFSLVAHSMGSLISTFALMHGYIKPDRAIFSAPLFGVTHPVPAVLLKAVTRFATRFGCGERYIQKNLQRLKKFENNVFTNSEERFNKRYSAPFYEEGVTFGWGHATTLAFEYVFAPENLAKINKPLRVLLGQDERIVSNSESKRWLELARQHCKTDVSYTTIPNTRHELFAEARPAYDEVLAQTRTFLGLV